MNSLTVWLHEFLPPGGEGRGTWDTYWIAAIEFPDPDSSLPVGVCYLSFCSIVTVWDLVSLTSVLFHCKETFVTSYLQLSFSVKSL